MQESALSRFLRETDGIRMSRPPKWGRFLWAVGLMEADYIRLFAY
ncbi:hypothetical protein BOO71_0010042 [Deinococcus marmoris]|uniref:Uncharacterized protein n=1 Tax=Deinococcus marmoris TaxID=249408 RepID=A0A1U7NVY9_9DEIO|nr:hypothetical protein BOO71_0010042 [Deinococcus marmoris]